MTTYKTTLTNRVEDKMVLNVNNFALQRHTKDSYLSHYDGGWNALIEITKKHFSSAIRSGNGVWKVSVPPEGFYSSVVKLKDGDLLVGSYSSRTKGETPRKHLNYDASGKGYEKVPAKSVTIIVYEHETLKQCDENSHPFGHEIVSVNASPWVGDEPQNPESLMHNHFGSDGGTATGLTDAEFLQKLEESFHYWKDKALAS